MIEVTSQQGAVLAFMSLSTVGFICALCMRCRKKSMIVQENSQLYIPQILHREGSRFAVTKSKTVMCANQISTNPPESSGNVAHPSYRQLDSVPDLEGSYQNIAKSNRGSMEPTYVDPIATPPDESSALNNDSEYANIYRPQEIKHDSSEDYENTDFLHTHKTDDNDESDYVNIESTN
ncbi:LAT2 domain-containing protein isoform X2 [Tachysurus fulvidraco]|uniref:LAT2 domain-containing protein isoform X2 n=1 Tax=Tachysurus fulvidraco TaxID=1234273 RepID=UPI001FEF7E40|nr:LAT2 domain-containing protein isoform X2 [Tachysurus fulvidraco]